MFGKPVSGDPPAGGDQFLHEIKSLSKALSLDSKIPNSRNPNPKNPKPKEKKPSFWRWKPLRALSHSRHRRLDCLFSLHVHSIENVPPALSAASLSVHWRRAANPSSSAAVGGTHPSRPFHGVAEFEETLTHRCSVYRSRSGSGSSAKYEAQQFLIYVSVAEFPGLDLGRHLVDLTRVLPLSLEELDGEEKSSGKWSTSFRLSGKGKGASLNVSFGYSLLGDGSAVESGGEKKVSEILDSKVGRQDSRGRVGSLIRSRDRSRSMEDVKVLHEVLPSCRSEVFLLDNVGEDLEYSKYDHGKLDDLEVDSRPEFEVFAEQNESPDLKSCTTTDTVKEFGEEREAPNFTVIEQGIEIATKDQFSEPGLEKIELETNGVEEVGGIDEEEVGEKPDEQGEEISYDCHVFDDSNSLHGDQMMEDFDSAFHSLSVLEPDGFESPHIESGPSNKMSYSEFKSNYKMGSMKSKSHSFDEAPESVASEFLSMLGIEHSPFVLSSDSDPESPRERLWKQFKEETLTTSNDLFSLDAGSGNESNWGDLSEEFDLSSIVHEAEAELRKATETMDSRSRAKMLEDAETEALMREWGFNEKAFQQSPPGSRSGFGSPIDLPLEEPLELPPLSEGLGSIVQTKDGGFLRSMSPSLFKNAKNNGSLIMQVSSPVVVPSEMGSGVMDILQCLASMGIEKLSMQAKKLMPLEDITGKTLQQIAWEASPALVACGRQGLLPHHKSEAEVRVAQNTSAKSKKGTNLNLASSRVGELTSEYVSLEDLAPLAMDKIEALSVEGLRIQSGLSDEEAPSNISPQSIGDISALQGKGAMNSRSLGLEGTAGLQLLDVKDSGDDVDGLMGLSITLDEWMRLDSGILDEEDCISDRTSKILAAHHACSTDLSGGGWKGDKRRGKRSGRRWGLLGNNFTVALMVQLRDPLRNYEPVGTPMLSLIQVERVFLPPKPKIYSSVSEKGNSEQDDDAEANPEPLAKEEKKEEEDAIPQFKITEVHVAGLKTQTGKKKPWGNSMQQQSGSRWLLATGMGKSNKHPFMKSKAVSKPSQATTKVQPGDTLWSISSRVHGTGAKWKELLELNPHIRNPNVIFPNETIRLR